MINNTEVYLLIKFEDKWFASMKRFSGQLPLKLKDEVQVGLMIDSVEVKCVSYDLCDMQYNVHLSDFDGFQNLEEFLAAGRFLLKHGWSPLEHSGFKYDDIQDFKF